MADSKVYIAPAIGLLATIPPISQIWSMYVGWTNALDVSAREFVVPIVNVSLHAMVTYGLVMRKRWAAYIALSLAALYIFEILYLFGSAVVENTLVTFAHWSRALLTTIIVIGLAITCSVLALRVNMKADA